MASDGLCGTMAKCAPRWLAGSLWFVLAAANAVSGQIPPVEQEPDVSVEKSAHFSESIFCGICHTNATHAQAMRDADGHPVAPFGLWQTSMMAHASRDPLWQAYVSAEINATPSKKDAIEQKCSSCHAPMAMPVPASPAGQLLTYLHDNGPLGSLARDGVSCTLCHQITATRLGTVESFNGGYVLGHARAIFGPYADPMVNPMKMVSGYTPVHGTHMRRSALCGSCHNLTTDSLDADGTANGHSLHEQSPYSEWTNSIYNDESERPADEARSCQDCHMPSKDAAGTPIRTRIARAPGGADIEKLAQRTPYAQHVFRGPNTMMLRILRDNPQELGVRALKDDFNRSIAAGQKFLRGQTATLEFGTMTHDQGQITVPVTVSNLAGHKLPTSFPSRRVWIRLEIKDGDDRSIFVSGAFNRQGQLIGPDGSPLPSELAGGPILPHRQRITKPTEVQVYEAVMADKNGKATATLLRGASYLKDNRLLPRGWSSTHPDAEQTAPAGVNEDPDFRDGRDVVVYEVPAVGQGPWTVHAMLVLQVLSARDASELVTIDTPEVRRFHRLYQSTDRRPELISSVQSTLNAKRP